MRQFCPESRIETLRSLQNRFFHVHELLPALNATLFNIRTAVSPLSRYAQVLFVTAFGP